jgi:predicted metalloprotease with PDZ domain
VGATLRYRPPTDRVVVRLPAWTPGSYLIRDYVRWLDSLTVLQAGRTLPVERTDLAAWRFTCVPDEPLQIHYGIQATELTVRTCHADADHAFLALAAVALRIEAERWSPHRLELLLPPDWRAFVPLPRQGEGWLARDYDQLVDSPVEAGPHPSHDFTVAGVPHRWVSWGDDLPGGDPHWLADVEKVCLACCRLMGEAAPPSPDPYLFVLHLLERGYGGLEHDQATVLQYGRRDLARPEGRRRLLQLVAHEYLHRWNVKRLRPAELSPIDYDRAPLVSSLWFAEGITSYLDQLLPVAAGCAGEEELLEDVGADLSRYLLTPGRRVQTLRQSSLEAWVKLYRQDAHSADTQVSYYLKGAVLALVLDLHLRRHGSALTTVLRRLWRTHGRWRRGYREEDLIAAFAEQVPDLAHLLPAWLESTEDPDLDAHLADVGLKLVPEPSPQRSMGWQVEEDPPGSLRLRRVSRDGPAQEGGLAVADELIAIDGQRLRQQDDLAWLLDDARLRAEEGRTGTTRSLPLLFCRDGRVRTATVRPAPPVPERWRLRIDDAAPAEAAVRRARWLSLEP